MTNFMRKHSGHRHALVALIALSGIVLASCSSSKPPVAHHSGHSTTTTTTTTAPSSTSSTVAGAAGPPCAISALSGTVAAFDAASGGAATAIVLLTNSSKKACSLSGYPGIQLLSQSGNIATTVEQGGAGIPTTLTSQVVNLAAKGGQASFLLYWVAVPSSSEPTCTLAPKMKVSVPGSANTVTMTAEVGPFGGILEASPFQPGLLKT
jgi:hypothetical protein